MTESHVELEAATDQRAMFHVIEEHLRLFPHMLKNDGIHTLYRIVGTYLASLPQQTAEPVAWRWRWGKLGGDQPWHLSPTKPGPFREDGYEVEPLYTHPASPPVGGAVTVKTLEWVEDGDGHWKAPALTGTYHIVHKPGDLFQLRMSWSLMLYDAQCRSLDAAKAAAAADYEQRILSALASSERSADEVAR